MDYPVGACCDLGSSEGQVDGSGGSVWCRVPLPSFRMTNPDSSMKDSNTFPLWSFLLPPHSSWWPLKSPTKITFSGSCWRMDEKSSLLDDRSAWYILQMAVVWPLLFVIATAQHSMEELMGI